ncbi:MAG: hypothetical protein ABI886_02175 [Betaproteobacteria bacterium]
MTFDTFLDEAWRDHGERPEEVAARLEQGYALIEMPAQIAPFARLIAHVDGEHLARWRDGAARLARLRSHPKWTGDGDAPAIVRRLIAALGVAGGDEMESGLDGADRAHAHAVAAAALIEQRDTAAAIRHFRSALAAAAPGLPERDPAIRALAVASNNVASALEEQPLRDAGQTRAMLEAAAASREYWAQAGTWLETERAEYVLAKCHLAVGDAAAALEHAMACVAICERNGADGFERFFAQAALALARRAGGDAAGYASAKDAALGCHAALAANLLPWCEPTLRLLT